MYKRRIIFFVIAMFSLTLLSHAAEEPISMEMSKDYKKIQAKTIKKIKLPKGYHEGLYYDGKNIWVCNGKGMNTWVMNIESEGLEAAIKPIAGFTEAMSKAPDGRYFVTDWYERKIYIVVLIDEEMAAESSFTVAPAHPAGVLWNGKHLYVITWMRGLGTKFELVEMDADFKLIRKININKIQEPAHLAWDGKHLWITSWYNSYVYKVDADTMEILESFRAPMKKCTGITWDGNNLWVTGTYDDLYQIQLPKIDEPAAENGGDVMAIKIISSAFIEGGMMPKKYTCDGDEVSPPLEWSGIPQGTKSIALISDDPDAPAKTWVHWLLFNLPADTARLPEGVPNEPELENGARQGINDSGRIGYGSPCPPSGTHRYYFKVYALDTMLKLDSGITKRDLEAAMKGHILSEASLMGRYKR